jgi:hypothetical protein
MQMARHKRSERGITLVEMIVVVAIAVMMMRLLLPAFKGLGGSKQSFAATTQFIGDLSTARLMAMNNGSPVYVVFMPLAQPWGSPATSQIQGDPPAGLRPYFELPNGGNPRLGGQLVSYAFYAEYVLGDSLGNPSRRWLSDWKQLPEGAFFPSEMLKELFDDNRRYGGPPGNNGELYIPHVRNNGPSGPAMFLPYIGFDERGRLIGVMGKPNDRGAIIRLVEGGVLPPEIDSSTGNFLVENADEPLNIGRAENYVLINFLTGRARTTVIKAVPAGNKQVKIRIIRFTVRLWKWKDPNPTLSARKGWIGFGEFLKENKISGYYQPDWSSRRAYRLIEGQWVLKDGVVAPDVIVNIQAKLASKLQEKVLRVDPDADLLIME